ncbi:MAG: response regulator, partial [Rhodospirillaceae bacterium]|nr:response regulator [Rhodospirillaceae bacterium]
GSVFSVTVPCGTLAEAAEAAVPRPVIRAGELTGAVVLCIDDNPDVRDGMEALLGGWNCDVRTAAAGSEWRRELGGDAPDIIVADYHLAGDEKGPDVITEVCGVYERVIPAIIVTADPSEELREEAGRRGHVVLAKPVKPASLRALMTRMLAQRATVRRAAS